MDDISTQTLINKLKTYKGSKVVMNFGAKLIKCIVQDDLLDTKITISLAKKATNIFTAGLIKYYRM